jgi:hypothetical protein
MAEHTRDDAALLGHAQALVDAELLDAVRHARLSIAKSPLAGVHP